MSFLIMLSPSFHCTCFDLWCVLHNGLKVYFFFSFYLERELFICHYNYGFNLNVFFFGCQFDSLSITLVKFEKINWNWATLIMCSLSQYFKGIVITTLCFKAKMNMWVCDTHVSSFSPNSSYLTLFSQYSCWQTLIHGVCLGNLQLFFEPEKRSLILFCSLLWRGISQHFSIWNEHPWLKITDYLLCIFYPSS